MNKLFSFLMLFFFVLNTNSAQTDLSTAVDFSIVDRYGEEHNLYQILDREQYVLIDFFTHYCAPCCDIAPDINNLYFNYGCNKSQLHVISIEGAGNITELEFFEDTCGGASEKPVATGIEGNGVDVSLNYKLGAFPTVILIGPDRKIIEADIWPFNYEIATDILDSYGISTSICPTPNSLADLETQSSIIMTPNPASTHTSIEFYLAESSYTNVQLINMTGQLVHNVYQGKRLSGINTIDLNTADFSAGTYILQVETEKSNPQISKLIISN